MALKNYNERQNKIVIYCHFKNKIVIYCHFRFTHGRRSDRRTDVIRR